MMHDSYQINRSEHPAIEFYWIAESVQRGRPVILYELSCNFCKRTLVSDFKGEIALVINGANAAIDFERALTVRCKLCKQNYRIVVADSFLR